MSVEVTREHMAIAERVAWKFARKIPPGADVDALFGVCCEALARSAKEWNGRGDFERWAVQRMYFAMLDELRRIAPSSRAAMRAARKGVA